MSCHRSFIGIIQVFWYLSRIVFHESICRRNDWSEFVTNIIQTVILHFGNFPIEFLVWIIQNET
ncbi:hypothetical protein BRC90_10180 [Halobacteriales archaeon QS_4_69_34]|nr:MAG: hypothetical protein BRC90_10180 [Halobacteriales archaeon QS_4_69_34]